VARSWTDVALADAIETSRSWADVCRRLGLTSGGSTRTRLRRRATELGLDTRHIGHTPSGSYSRTWTDEQLTEVVGRVDNLHGVFEGLGLRVGGGAWVAMKEHIRRLRLDLQHWSPDARAVVMRGPGSRRALPPWTDEEIREAFRGARSVAEIMRRLGLDAHRNRGRREVERRLEELGLDTTSLPGKGWSRGTSPDRRAHRRPLAEILVPDSSYGSSRHLKTRLVEEGLLEPTCEDCGICTWNDRPLTLQLDHINGDRRDNRLDNLRLLCPNCHSQTPTYCGRNTVGRYAS
jgi:hypothetical protein